MLIGSETCVGPADLSDRFPHLHSRFLSRVLLVILILAGVPCYGAPNPAIVPAFSSFRQISALFADDDLGAVRWRELGWSEVRGLAAAQEEGPLGGGLNRTRRSGPATIGGLELPYALAFLVVGFVFGLSVWVILLRREVDRRLKELQRNTALIQESRTLLKRIIESTDDIVLAKNLEGKYILANPAAERFIGSPATEIIGKDATQVFAAAGVNRFTESERKVLERGQVETRDEGVVFADGRRHLVVTTRGPLRDEQGQVIGLFEICRDVTERAQVTRALQVSEARLVAAQRIAHLGSWEMSVTDTETSRSDELWWSDEVFRIFGYTPGQVTPTRELFRQAVHPDDRQEVAAAIQNALKTRDAYELDHRIVLPSGIERVVHEHAEVICDGGQRPLRLSGTVQDITDRRLMEIELRQSQDRFKRLFLDSPLATSLTSLVDGKFIDVNERFVEATGYTREEALGRTADELGVWCDVGQMETLRELLRKGGVLRNFEGRLRSRYGQEYDVLIEGQVVDLPAGPASLVQAVDVTERKRIELALRESEERYRTVFQTTHQGFFVMRDAFLDCNEQACRIWACSREDIIGRSLLDFSPPTQPDGQESSVAASAYIAAARSGTAQQFYWQHRRKDGAIRDAEVQLAPLRVAGSDLLLVSLTDITDRRRAEEVRKQLEVQLRQSQKMEAVGQLAGGVAHDFNNILAALLMHVDLLRHNPNATQDIVGSATEMKSLVERAAALTRQLLLFGRRQMIQPHLFDLNSLLGNLLKMLGRLIGEHITLTFAGVQEALWIEADPGMIEQVITNLVVNARDAMPRGGKLELLTSAVVLDAAHVTAHPQARTGAFAVLTVTDTGMGMEEGTLKRIFEPFFTTKDVGKGTGLGLSTVYSIVQQHQGWLEVESEVGKGSSFRVFLPAREKPQVREPREFAAVEPPRGTETILVVEDERPVRLLTVRTLERLGYTVLEAASGPDALRVWEKQGQNIDLLLTDVVMPEGLGGFELAGRLKELQPRLRVVLMSGYSAEMMSQGFSVPAGTVFVQKPFAPGNLAIIIRRLLDRK
jgi:PAS domain S-box-containing protein